MDVDVPGERLLERLDAGHVGEHAQLDLRVVGRHQPMAVLGDEGAADLAALLGADRDVLQVRIVRRQPAGRGRRHGVGGVHAAIGRIDLADQGVGVGAGQLLQLAPGEDRRGQRMALGGQRLEHVGAGRVAAGLGLARGGQALLLEQHLAQLLGRAEIEGAPGQPVGLPPRARPCARRSPPTAPAAPCGRPGCRAAPSRPAPRPAAAPGSRRPACGARARRASLSIRCSRSVTSATSAQ